MEEYEIELELTKLMQDLQQNAISLETNTSLLNFLLEDVIKSIEEVSKPYNEKSVEIQTKIKELTLIRAKSLKTGSGNITYRKGGIRRSWDLDLLDEACDINPHVKQAIWSYRTETPTDPQVLIKVENKGKSAINI